MLTSPNLPLPTPDEQPWQEEGGFFHGWLNGLYYRMVCSQAELEELRLEVAKWREDSEAGPQLSLEELWQIIDEQYCPEDAHFGPFEPESPFEDDLDFDARRKLIAMKMIADPTTTTWFGLSRLCGQLIGVSQKARQHTLHQRLNAWGIDPKQARKPEVQRLWMLALEFGLNPFTATEEEVDRCQLELHKVAVPRALAQRAHTCQDASGSFSALLLQALEAYLMQYESGKDG